MKKKPIGNDVTYAPTSMSRMNTQPKENFNGISYRPTAFNAQNQVRQPKKQNNPFSWTGINYRPTAPFIGEDNGLWTGISYRPTAFNAQRPQIATPTGVPKPNASVPTLPKPPTLPNQTTQPVSSSLVKPPTPNKNTPQTQQNNISQSMNQTITTQPQQPMNPFEYGPYTSQYQGQMADLMGQLNGNKFSYDLESDPLYQQYKTQYLREGNRAMEDSMATASALTGGRTNTWSQAAGAGAFSNYLSALNDKVPELYDSAYRQYANEQSLKMNQLQMLQQQEQMAYDRYNQDRNVAYGQYRDQIGDQRYNKEFDYQMSRDQVGDQRYQQQFDYQAGRDNIADQQWQKQFEVSEQQRQLDNAYRNGQMSLQQYQAETGRIQAQYQMYADQRDYDRGIYTDDRNFNYQQSQDERNYNLAQQKAAGKGTPGAGLEYKDQLKLVMDMKNATQEQIMVPDGKNNIYDKPQKYDVPKYDDAEIADYIMSLNISDEEKVRMLNDAGVKKNDSPIQQRGIMGYNQTSAPFQMTVPNEQSKKKSKLPKFVIGSRWGV